MANDSQPQQNDLVLGENSPLPTTEAILGGIQGLHQRLAVASPDQKVKLLPQSLNYGEAGIDVLVEAVNDAALMVRATACQLLQRINSPKAQQAIANGLRLSPGDRIYSVYQSHIGYNDNWEYLADSVDKICHTSCFSMSEFRNQYEYGLVSQHISKENAEIIAQILHQQRSLEENISNVGHYEDFRGDFNTIEWCKTNHVLVRFPGESRSEFEQRINTFYSLQNDSRFGKKQQFIWKEWEKEDYEIDGEWKAERELEHQVMKVLKTSGQHELLGQLWLDAVGKLAFVHEEIVSEPVYIRIIEDL